MERIHHIFKSYGLSMSYENPQIKMPVVKERLIRSLTNSSIKYLDEATLDFFAKKAIVWFFENDEHYLIVENKEKLLSFLDEQINIVQLPDGWLNSLRITYDSGNFAVYAKTYYSGIGAMEKECVLNDFKHKEFLKKVDSEMDEEEKLKQVFDPKAEKQFYLSQRKKLLSAAREEIEDSLVLETIQEKVKNEVRLWINDFLVQKKV